MKTRRIFAVMLAVFLLITALPAGAISTFSEEDSISKGLCPHPENFAPYPTPTGNGAADMIAIAFAQEGRTGAEFQYEAGWCAQFVSDCATLAGQSAAIPSYGGVSGLKELIITAGGSDSTSNPQPGDICFIDWDGNGGYFHVEIVYDVSGGRVYTIGGNSGGDNSYDYTMRFVKRHAPLSNNVITCIVRPAYVQAGYLSSCSYTTNDAYVTTTNSSTKIWTLPCNNNTNPLSEAPYILPAGVTLHVTGDIINDQNHNWYEIDYDGGTYYVYGNNIEFSSFINDAEINHPNPPSGNLHQYDFFNLTETVSSRHKIIKIVGKILREDGSEACSPGKITPNVRGTVSISGTAVDTTLAFGSLPVGTYKYRLEATIEAESTLVNYCTTFTSIFQSTFTIVPAGSTTVMTASEFISYLQIALSRNTVYNNSYPRNLGYYDGNTISWDCWNLGKSIIWSGGSIVNNYSVGHYQSPNTSCGLGDWDGETIIHMAPNCNGDFSNLVPGEWLYMQGHIGYYIGDGQVIECTKGWGVNCVTQSQIDSSGRRSRNGVSNGTWLLHGMVPWIDYSSNGYLDLNGYLDGVAVNDIRGYGTVDIYINGEQVMDDIDDFYTDYPYDTDYEFKDIKPYPGYSYDGIYSGNRSGTVGGGQTVVLSFSRNDFSTITETPVGYTSNGHTYYYYSTPVSWYFAKEFCESQGGHLVTINNAVEDEFVRSLMPYDTTLWAGGTDAEVEGTWKWLTGEIFWQNGAVVTYAHWNSEEPNNSEYNSTGTEEYLMINSNGTWNDAQGCETRPFILEIDGHDSDHTIVSIPASNPTCTTAGNIGYYYCSDCDKYYSDADCVNEITPESVIIPALGHDFVDETIVATCVQPVGVRHTCSRCDYSYIEYPDANCTEWSTDYPTGVAENLIESRTEYRYRDRQTVESTNPALNGGTPYDHQVSYGLWSDWQDAAINPNSTTDVETRTVYAYYYFQCPSCGAHMHVWNVTCPTWAGGCGQAYIPDSSWHIHWSTTPHDQAGFADWHGTGKYYAYVDGELVFKWQDGMDRGEAVKTQYRSRSIIDTYYYWQWGEWSEWGTDQIEATDTREVETRTVYRYVTSGFGEHVWNNGVVTTDPTYADDGVMTYTCTVCGATRTEPIPHLLGHTVTFKDWDGTILKTETVEHGGAATAPADPTRPGYVFTGWSRAFDNVTSDLIIRAVYAVDPADPTAPRIVVESKAVPAGSSFIVDISIENNPGIISLILDVSFDNGLTLTNIQNTCLLNGYYGNSNLNSPCLGWIDFDATVDNTSNGVIATLTFTTSENAQLGDYQISILARDCCNYDLSPVDFAIVNGMITVVEPEPETYTVTYNIDGVQYAVQTYEVGAQVIAPAYTAPEGYDFSGWNVPDTMPAMDITLNANTIIRRFTVIWQDWDGTILKTDTNVAYGTTPAYGEADPTRPATEQYTYTFTGWAPEIAPVHGNITYTASYSSAVNKYTVIWANWDGSVLETDTDVPYGTMPVYNGDTPEKPSTPQYAYTFAGWAPVLTSVNGNITYTATFTESIRKYTVVWKNWDETTIEVDINIPYGAEPSYDGVTPGRQASAQYTYVFNGWTPEISVVTGNITYTAVFSEVLNHYNVVWVNWDETILETDTYVPYGTVPTFDSPEPTRPALDGVSYEFVGWTPEVVPVSGNTVYMALFVEAASTYTVTFKDWDGTILKTESVGYGGNATPPADPSRDGYTFIGWSGSYTNVTSDREIVAQYEQDPTPTPDPNAVQITISTVNAIPGREVSIDVSVTGEYSAHGMELDIDFNTESLTFVEYIRGEVWEDALSKGGIIDAEEGQSGQFMFRMGLPSNPESMNGVIFTLKFTVADDVAIGTVIPLTLTVDEFYSAPGGFVTVPIPFVAVNGCINVNYRMGDINGDGKVNTFDAILAMRYSMHLIEFTDNMVFLADINHDGKVNTFDAILIMRISMGLLEL